MAQSEDDLPECVRHLEVPSRTVNDSGLADMLSMLSANAIGGTSLSTHSSIPQSLAPSQENCNEKIIEISPDGVFAKLSTVLGKGSCKVVWKAINRDEGVEVAWNCVKTTKDEYSLLSQEIEILKKVRHPNIITFHDSWYNNNGEFVFITELMPSGTLREYVKKFHPVNFKIIRKWCKQILKGLHSLHSHRPPIIHRDIKCDNIFINGSQGEVKIGDMGTAKMKFGQKYTVIGTPEFMAPEMYEDQGYNEKVDIYAFGMCLLEMATGEYPYGECKNAAQIYKRVSQGIRPECLSLVHETELYSLIQSCLAEEKDRPSLIELMNHPFFNVDPELQLVAYDEAIGRLTIQLTNRKTSPEKPPIKFDFDVASDTAEVVVQEMITENYLDSTFKASVIAELNKLIRGTQKYGFVPEQLSSSPLADAISNLSISKRSSPTREKGEGLLINLDTPHNQSSFSGEFVADDEEGEEAESVTTFMDTDPIEVFVNLAAHQARRSSQKAAEWAQRLRSQDVISVGDLRQLHPEDWSSLKLTVFACRALKNLLSKSVFK